MLSRLLLSVVCMHFTYATSFLEKRFIAHVHSHTRTLSVYFTDSIPQDTQSLVQVGAARTSLYLPLLEDQRVGLVAHASSRIGDTHLVDSLLALGVMIQKIFSPEHGFRSNYEAGAHISSRPSDALPIVSLYGSKKKPSAKDVSNIDVLVFDLQDVGARFYTYLSTLHYIMETSAEYHIPLIVLDRPNPNGDYVDGPILEPSYQSFVGLHPVPIVHGLTLGEFAQMINGEGWLSQSIRCELKVIPIKEWTHRMSYQLVLPPSPNLPTFQSVRLYPSLCLFEGTVMSIGRGTPRPFEAIGYPNPELGDDLFTPQSIPGKSLHPKHESKRCYGISLHNYPSTQQLLLEPLMTFYHLLSKDTSFFLPYFDKLAGTSTLREQIEGGVSEKSIRETWEKDVQAYQKIRKKYLLYEDFE